MVLGLIPHLVFVGGVSNHTKARKNIYAAHFTENCFKQNLSLRRFLGSAFTSRRLDLKEEAVPTSFTAEN